MTRVLVIALAWLAFTAVIALVIGRAIRRADAKEERRATKPRRSVPEAAGTVRPGTPPPRTSAEPGPPEDVDGCALTRPRVRPAESRRRSRRAGGT